MTILDGMKLSILFGVAVQLYLLIVYVIANRTKRHKSFFLLISAAALTLVYSALTSASYFIEIPQDIATDLYRYGLFIFFPAAVLGVLGVRSLVKAYIATPHDNQPGKQSSTDGWGN